MGNAHAGHDHSGGAGLRSAQRKVLWWSLVANASFMVVEIIGGLAFGSLALLADAAHMASDVIALGIALAAQSLMERPASARHSFGLKRAEVIGAQVNGLLLMGLSGAIVFEAIRRTGRPLDVDGGGLLVVAFLGLLVNLGSAVAIRRRASGNLNMRGAYLHMALDAVGSVGALVAGALVVLADFDQADPLVSVGIAGLVAYSSALLLKETWHVLLEGTPAGMETEEIDRALRDDRSVEEVHHLHAWSIASDTPAMSAHVILAGEMSLHEAQEHGRRLKVMLADRFGIEHATLELECHPCDP